MKETGALLRITKKKFIKISQTKQQKGVWGDLRPQPMVLLHHGCGTLGHGPFSPDP